MPQLRLRIGITACQCSSCGFDTASNLFAVSVDKMRSMTQAKNMKSTWHVQFAGIIVSDGASKS